MLIPLPDSWKSHIRHKHIYWSQWQKKYECRTNRHKIPNWRYYKLWNFKNHEQRTRAFSFLHIIILKNRPARSFLLVSEAWNIERAASLPTWNLSRKDSPLPVTFEKLVKYLGYYTTINILLFQQNLKLFVKFKWCPRPHPGPQS